MAILAFVTDDLTRDRFWRTVVRQNGQERVMVSTVPDPLPSWDTATDAFLLNSKATKEWCQTMLASQHKDDPIVAELEQALVDGQRRSSLLADPLSTSQSFVLDSLIHSDPFHSTYNRTGPSQMPRHTLTDFEDDERAAKKMAEIRSTGVPVVLVHLATYKELAEGEEYLGAERERHRDLVNSLERLAGREVYETLDHVARPIEDLEKIPVNVERDHHPSLKGHRFYAGVVAEILLRRGFIGAH